MSTIKEIIERVDENKPNAFSTQTKMAWLSQLDGKIATDVLLMNIVEIRQLEYKYPECLNHQPLVTYPHEEIYDLWLKAMIDYEDGEYDKYANSMAMFNEVYDNFAAWFLTVYEPAQGYRREGFR